MAVASALLSQPPVGAMNFLVGLGLALVAACLYFAFEELLANKSRHERLWMGAA